MRRGAPLTSFCSGALPPVVGEGEDAGVHQGPVLVPLTVEAAASSRVRVQRSRETRTRGPKRSRDANQSTGRGGRITKAGSCNYSPFWWMRK